MPQPILIEVSNVHGRPPTILRFDPSSWVAYLGMTDHIELYLEHDHTGGQWIVYDSMHPLPPGLNERLMTVVVQHDPTIFDTPSAHILPVRTFDVRDPFEVYGQ